MGDLLELADRLDEWAATTRADALDTGAVAALARNYRMSGDA